MNYFVISDIHGSSYYLKLALECYHANKYDGILLLGDVLYHGPRNPLPKEYDTTIVYTKLNELKEEIIAIRGNCDSEVDQMVLQYPMMETSKIIQLGNRTVLLTHGHVDSVIQRSDSDCVLSGHTHIPTADYIDQCYYLNPGSISLPKGGYPPSYGILTDTSFQVISLLDQSVIKEIQLK
ncbi:MAG: phosphodiesterase [Erysipelotrichaceae bacterium]|nr:phosphodiesterase [Erysipelotrichaceae bacterium]